MTDRDHTNPPDARQADHASPRSAATPASMDCTGFCAVISGFVDGELDVASQRDAERHLVSCAACREVVECVERVDLDLRALSGSLGGDRPLSAQLVDAVLDRTVRPRRQQWWLRVAGGMGWAAAAAIGVAWIFTAQSVTQSPSQAGGLLDGRLGDQSGLGSSGTSRMVATPDDRNVEFDGTQRVVASATTGSAPSMGEDRTEKCTKEPERSRTATPILVDRGYGPTGGPDHDGAAEVAAASVTTGRRCGSSICWHPGAAQSPADGRSQPQRIIARDDRHGGLSPLAPPLATRPLGAWTPPDRLSGTRTAEGRQLVDPARVGPQDADAIFAASLLLDRLSGMDAANLDEIERLRYVISYDQLVDRLATTRRRLDPADRPLITGAECFLIRLLRGPVEEAVILQMQIDLDRIGLHEKLEQLSDRLDLRSTF